MTGLHYFGGADDRVYLKKQRFLIDWSTVTFKVGTMNVDILGMNGRGEESQKAEETKTDKEMKRCRDDRMKKVKNNMASPFSTGLCKSWRKGLHHLSPYNYLFEPIKIALDSTKPRTQQQCPCKKVRALLLWNIYTWRGKPWCHLVNIVQLSDKVMLRDTFIFITSYASSEVVVVSCCDRNS